MAKILLIEDDPSLTKMMNDWLALEHHSLESVGDGKEGFDRLQIYNYDLVIIDWQLPGMEGPDVVKSFRAAGGTLPILMLTGKSAVSDKEIGFDSGADDYLTKPFHMKELSARIRALLRRPSAMVSNILTIGRLSMDPVKHVLQRDGVEIKLLPKEFALLEFFMRHPNQVFNADALLNRVWSSESDATIDALTSCIKRLRKKVDLEGEGSCVKTVHGVGYKMEAP
jgi:DNA-binding response OmpR family regulator